MGNRNGPIGLSNSPGPGPLPVGGGGMISFGSASTTQYSLCPAGHARYLVNMGHWPNIYSANPNIYVITIGSTIFYNSLNLLI